MTSQTDEKGRPMTYFGGKTDESCPHVYTSKGGTSHCTLAASEIDRHLAEIDRLKRQVEVLRGGYHEILNGYHSPYLIAKERLDAADDIAKE